MDGTEDLSPVILEGDEEEGPYRRRSAWLFRIVALVLALSMLALFALRPAPEDGIQRLPRFELERLGADGETFGSDDLEGAPVVVNFWASWCIPCREEMPLLERTWQRYRDQGIQFVGIAVRDSPQKAEAFAERLGITYPIVFDPDLQLIEQVTDFDGLPLTFFVQADGSFLDFEGRDSSQIGAVSEQQLVDAIEALLDTGTA